MADKAEQEGIKYESGKPTQETTSPGAASPPPTAEDIGKAHKRVPAGKYERLDQLNIPAYRYDGDSFHFVCSEDVDTALPDGKIEEFSRLFGVQTAPIVMGVMALYAWDVEAVLERMLSGRLRGSQLLWD